MGQTTEIWKYIPDFTGYAVSSCGRIKRLPNTFKWRPTEQILSPHIANRYKRIGLRVGKRQIKKYVHQLVASAFIGIIPNDHEVNHKDGNKLNNCAENLEYVTRQDNAIHARQHKLHPSGLRHHYHIRPETRRKGEQSPVAKLTEPQVREIRQRCANGENRKQIATDYGISLAHLKNIKNRKSWTHIL